MYDKSTESTSFNTCFLCGASILPGESDTGNVCLNCRAKERDRVNNHLRRAELVNTLATLTLAEWLQTLHDFGGKCAYCEENPFTELEHFIPLRDGGGTTADNCVPACKLCNRGKGIENPNVQPGLPGLGDDRLDGAIHPRIRSGRGGKMPAAVRARVAIDANTSVAAGAILGPAASRTVRNVSESVLRARSGGCVRG